MVLLVEKEDRKKKDKNQKNRPEEIAEENRRPDT